jgi:galactokinase
VGADGAGVSEKLQAGRPSLSGVAAAFQAWTGEGPEGVWAAPGRVNLIGEHLDYNGGHVLPFAIDRAAWLAVRRRRRPTMRCRSAQQTGVVEVPIDELRRASGWSAYLAGTAWALAEAGMTLEGADLYVDSDVPIGAGLSSSAALECVVALALAELSGLDADRRQLARLAQRAESEVAGAPVGIMDQTASLLGREGHALYLDTRTLQVDYLALPLDEAGFQLLMVDTGSPHQHHTGAYAARRSDCEQAAAALAVEDLATVPLGVLEGANLGMRLARRARHVVTEERRVHDAALALRQGHLDAVGPLMTASHRSMQHDFDISTPDLDKAVAAAVAAGAAGARLTGGGFGGTAIILARTATVPAVVDAVRKVLATPIRPRPEVAPVRPVQGARRVG